MNMIMIQSNMLKLEKKKNFQMWDLQIKSLLIFWKKLAAIRYILKLKSFISKKNLADTITEMLTETEHLQKAGITFSD